jgi:hypothetical protein
MSGATWQLIQHGIKDSVTAHEFIWKNGNPGGL